VLSNDKKSIENTKEPRIGHDKSVNAEPAHENKVQRKHDTKKDQEDEIDYF